MSEIEAAPPIMISRSAVITRKTCEMKRYLNYHEQLTEAQDTPGVVPNEEASIKGSVPRLRGQILHGAAEKLFLEEPLDPYLDEACLVLDPQVRDEQKVLIRRALKGWAVHRQSMLDTYTTMSSEQEWQWQMCEGVTQSLRLDRVLRSNEDQTLAILDFKTMRAPDKQWVARMMHSEQTHLYIQALRERSDEWVSGMIYEGIIIGSLNAQLQQKSPFVAGYLCRGDERIHARYMPGGKRVSLLGISDEEWLQWAQSQHILEELYCTTGLLLPSFAQLLETKNSVMSAELRWADRVQVLAQDARVNGRQSDSYRTNLEMLVEKNPDACLKYGLDYICPYHRMCWDGEQLDDSIYKAREDHHAT